MSDTTPERKANEGAAAEAVNKAKAPAVTSDAEAANAETVNTDSFDSDVFVSEAPAGSAADGASSAPDAAVAPSSQPTNDEAIELAYEPDSAPSTESPSAERAAAPVVNFSAGPASDAAAVDAPTESVTDAAAPTPAAEADAQAPVVPSVVPPALIPPAAETQAYQTPIDYSVADAVATPSEAVAPSSADAAAVATAAGVAAAASVAPGTAAVSPATQYAQTPQPIFVQAPSAPVNKGNRGVGILIALLSTVVFALLYAGCTYLVSLSQNPSVETAGQSFAPFLGTAAFYVPVIFFFAAFALLVAIVNRGGWWAYVLGAFAVAVIVYFSYMGGALLTVNAWELTPSQAGQFIASQWLNPVAIIAAIAAREVPIWFGAWIAARGRKVTAKNVAARREYDRVLAEGPSITRP